MDPVICDHITHELFNITLPGDRIRIDIYDTYMEIYKSKNMNSQYYEHIRTTNKRGKKMLDRFNKWLIAKELVAMTQFVEMHCTSQR